MHFTLLNLVSALAVGLIIGWMAKIPNVRLKATIYTLPIPITIALIATRAKINSSEVIGIILVCGFIWLTKLLYQKLQMPILLADTLAAIAYVAGGYVLIKLVHLNFATAMAIYLALWLGLVSFFHSHTIKDKAATSSTISPLLKASGTTFISFVMFSLKDVLAGVVVTFPFSGVFAVVEAKDQLEIFLRVVIRNTLAIIGLFVTLYGLQAHLNLFWNLLISWMVYFVILKLVQQVSV